MASPFSFGGQVMGQRYFRELAVGGVLHEVCAIAKRKTGSKRVSIVKSPAQAEVEEAIELAVADPAKSPPGPPVKDGQDYIKKELLKELSAITTKMIASAKGGGTAPLRLLWELGKLHEDATMKPKRRQPSLGKLLMDEIHKKDIAKKQPAKQTGKQT
jgi:hypothetical protein